MTSREDILGRVRARLARTPENAASGRAAIEQYLATHARGPQSFLPGSLSGRFREKSAGLSSSVVEVGELADVPRAVADYLRERQLPMRVVCWRELAGLAWGDVQIDIESRAVRGEDAVGVTGCFCVVAETGTLMLCSGADTPAATSLLPETHIAIVPASRIVADMEAAWQLLRAEDGGRQGGLPRAVNFISGPSRTGDIEQTIVLGAHGPYRVHLVLVRGR